MTKKAGLGNEAEKRRGSRAVVVTEAEKKRGRKAKPEGERFEPWAVYMPPDLSAAILEKQKRLVAEAAKRGDMRAVGALSNRSGAVQRILRDALECPEPSE